jgi:quinol monooxygenase YgiN
MSKKQITLVVRLKTKEGMGSKLEQAAVKLIPLTRAEPGCIEYNFHASAQDSDLFFFYENWIDQAALDKHAEMPYLAEFRTILENILDGPADYSFWNIYQ